MTTCEFTDNHAIGGMLPCKLTAVAVVTCRATEDQIRVCSQHARYLIAKDPDAYGESLWPIFHGLSGETLIVGQDEDGVALRADFHGTKLSALGARELAAHLVDCADRAEAWMADVAGMPPPVREHPAKRPLLDIRERLDDVIGMLSPEGHPPVCSSCGWSYSHDPGCADAEPEPDPAEPEPEYDPGPEVDDQGGMSDYRYHEPEPWQ